MNKVSKLFTLAILSIAASQSYVSANYQPNSGYPSGPNANQGYRQAATQNYQGRGNPNINAERDMMQTGQERYEGMRHQDRNMIKEDRNMIREGYDVNEQYYDNRGRLQSPNRPQTLRQEARMRGDMDSTNQSQAQPYSYLARADTNSTQGNEAATPRSYPLSNDYPNAPRNDNIKNQDSQDHNATSNRQTPRARYASDRYLVGDATETGSATRTPKNDAPKDVDKTSTSSQSAKRSDRPLADNKGTTSATTSSATRTNKQTSTSSLNKTNQHSVDEEDVDSATGNASTTKARSQR